MQLTWLSRSVLTTTAVLAATLLAQADTRQLPAVQKPAVDKISPQAPGSRGATALPSAPLELPIGMDIKTITPGQWQQLPGSTVIRIDSETMSKAQLEAKFAAAALNAPRPAGDSSSSLKQHQAELDRAHSTLVEATRTKALSLQAANGSQPAPPLLGEPSKALRLEIAPAITEVSGPITPGGYLFIKGSAFGATPGKVVLKGSFKLGQPLVGIGSWSESGIIANVELPQGGAVDQVVSVEVTTNLGKSVTFAVPVVFIAEKVTAPLPPSAFHVSISQNAWVNKASPVPSTDYSAGGWLVEHYSPHDGKLYTGQDTCSAHLENGWKISTVLVNFKDIAPATSDGWAVVGKDNKIGWAIRLWQVFGEGPKGLAGFGKD